MVQPTTIIHISSQSNYLLNFSMKCCCCIILKGILAVKRYYSYSFRTDEENNVVGLLLLLLLKWKGWDAKGQHQRANELFRNPKSQNDQWKQKNGEWNENKCEWKLCFMDLFVLWFPIRFTIYVDLTMFLHSWLSCFYNKPKIYIWVVNNNKLSIPFQIINFNFLGETENLVFVSIMLLSL